MRAFVFLLAALASAPIAASAEVTPEARPFVGAFIPTGDQRHVFKDALFTGGQIAIEVNEQFHLVGMLAFSDPKFKAQVPGTNHAHMYQSDIGGELFQNITLDNDWVIRPFVGLGGGIRTIDPSGTPKAKNYASGYGAIGTEIQLDRFAFRLETRDYLVNFKGITGDEKSSTRNEIAISAGLAFHLR